MSELSGVSYPDFSPAFAHIYLEESWVLSISASPGSVTFTAEIVLLPDHPNYTDPLYGDQFSYRTGTIQFSRVLRLRWTGQSEIEPSIDQDGVLEHGNFHFLTRSAEGFHIAGDWGQMMITTKTLPTLRWNPGEEK